MIEQLVHDIEPGDYLPEFGATVTAIDIVIDHPGCENASITLSDGRTMQLAGLDDITVAPAPD
ncbi:hypothetical protein ACNUDN_29140 [Mycobacterium sp. smrl_JER01]|jgi:hypothetical protein|uniref:Uncharacterized protein n=1 Tax=Mycobacterium dioxanotrophicus TaxID=482462 RepID=A0A1Y0CHR5_9MYCO|nr:MULTISPECIES: hypothetical protein [Mycobacterium]ART74486.1 hypothetical protein BTO20_38465 [Mycobacterium dioxanotrophicus]GAY16308.1 hypothetical protein MSZK_30340 [Mycobacterium sp. shizuoka-1]